MPPTDKQKIRATRIWSVMKLAAVHIRESVSRKKSDIPVMVDRKLESILAEALATECSIFRGEVPDA